jgi:hypothetical protein
MGAAVSVYWVNGVNLSLRCTRERAIVTVGADNGAPVMVVPGLDAFFATEYFHK